MKILAYINQKSNLVMAGRMLTLICLFIFTGNLAFAQTEEITILTTAQCKECKQNIEKALRDERGVKFAELDVKTKLVKVIYNSRKTDPDKLRDVISKTGYDADGVPADPEAVKKLSPCCTKDGHKH